ncbi:hypothetical protein APY03_2934 [Variovorax sp. WDL1]|nr:hypothetical protein APY03_2934 [Variovorax sp. WDL1]
MQRLFQLQEQHIESLGCVVLDTNGSSFGRQADQYGANLEQLFDFFYRKRCHPRAALWSDHYQPSFFENAQRFP